MGYSKVFAWLLSVIDGNRCWYDTSEGVRSVAMLSGCLHMTDFSGAGSQFSKHTRHVVALHPFAMGSGDGELQANFCSVIRYNVSGYAAIA